MHPPAGYACRIAGLIGTLAGVLAMHSVNGFAASSCLRIDQSGSGPYHLQGRFSSSVPTASYCFVARAGRHATIEIKPSAALDTEGSVQFTGTPAQTNWAPGGPGGVVFNETLPWTGEYRLVVGQRFNERKTGDFTVEITLGRP